MSESPADRVRGPLKSLVNASASGSLSQVELTVMAVSSRELLVSTNRLLLLCPISMVPKSSSVTLLTRRGASSSGVAASSCGSPRGRECSMVLREPHNSSANIAVVAGKASQNGGRAKGEINRRFIGCALVWLLAVPWNIARQYRLL